MRGNQGNDVKKKPKRRGPSRPDPLRVAEVLRIRIDGAQLHDVISYAAEQAWKVTEAECVALIRAADGLLVDRQDGSRNRVLARHIAQREALYARAVNGADYGTALSCIKDIAKLQGLYDRDSGKKELAELAQAQAGRIRELEQRLERGVIAIAPTVSTGGTNATEEARPETDACRLAQEGTGRVTAGAEDQPEEDRGNDEG